MIYNIAAKVLYANGYIQLAEYAFRKAKHLSDEDRLSLAIIYIKLFQRHLDDEYIKRAIQILVELRLTIQEANQLLERINQSPELKEYIEILIHNIKPYSQGEYDPIVYLIYDYFRSKGTVVEKSAIQSMVDRAINYNDDIMDRIMKMQAVVFALENNIEYTPEIIEYLLGSYSFPLGYNPMLLPKSIREKFLEIFYLDKKIIELRKLINRTNLPAIQTKIEENKQKLIELIKSTYLRLLAFYDNEQALYLSKLLIFSLVALPKEEKNRIYEELNF